MWKSTACRLLHGISCWMEVVLYIMMPVKVSPLRNSLFIWCTDLWIKLLESLNAVHFPSRLSPVCCLYFIGSQPDPSHSFLFLCVYTWQNMSRDDNLSTSLSLFALNLLKCTLKLKDTGALCSYSLSAHKRWVFWTSSDKERKLDDSISHFWTNNHSTLCQWNFRDLSVFSQMPQVVSWNNVPDSWKHLSMCSTLTACWCLLEVNDTEVYLWLCACLSAFECLTDILNSASISHLITPVLL